MNKYKRVKRAIEEKTRNTNNFLTLSTNVDSRFKSDINYVLVNVHTNNVYNGYKNLQSIVDSFDLDIEKYTNKYIVSKIKFKNGKGVADYSVRFRTKKESEEYYNEVIRRGQITKKIITEQILNKKHPIGMKYYKECRLAKDDEVTIMELIKEL